MMKFILCKAAAARVCFLPTSVRGYSLPQTMKPSSWPESQSRKADRWGNWPGEVGGGARVSRSITKNSVTKKL